MCIRDRFQSQYGKTECWHILSGHPVNGEEPCIYYGFQPDMTRARWDCLLYTSGCSPNFWLRAMGWFMVAMVDVDVYKRQAQGCIHF